MIAELSDRLVEAGLLSAQEAADSVEASRSSGQSLVSYLLSSTVEPPDEMVAAIEQVYEAPWVDLDLCSPDDMALSLVNEDLARRLCVLPLFRTGDRLAVAVSDPMDLEGLDLLRLMTGLEIEPLLASREAILDALTQNNLSEDLSSMVLAAPEELAAAAEEEMLPAEPLTEAEERPAIQMVNLMLRQAVARNASDIHLEPGDERMTLRYRIDGFLYQVPAPPRSMHRALIARLKILGDMDIAESRLPQDGRCVMQYHGRTVDLRLSMMPTIYGEGVVIRLIHQSEEAVKLEDLGMEPHLLEQFRPYMAAPNGIILVTGPTGSGKSTTLRGVLEEIRSPHRKVITLEDPVESRIDGVYQIPVKPDIGLTFAACLRSVLRHDPDVIMVGEVRDQETAEMAVRAALTGHLVLSTLHTNDAPSAVVRLIDLGLPHDIVATTMRGVLAQRLVRRTCPECRVAVIPDEEMYRNFRRLDPEVLPIDGPVYQARPGGCFTCSNIGYKGRLAIHEFMEFDADFRRMLSMAGSTEDFKRLTLEKSIYTMAVDGLHKIFTGHTTYEEVLRATLGGH